MSSTEADDVFSRLLAKQQELERMRRAIQELQTLDEAPAPEPEPEPEPDPEEEEEDPEDQKAIIEMLLKKRDELLRMQVRIHRSAALQSRLRAVD